ncbi:isopeptide-forming domain-containing fimbrial protein [Rhodococcus qingshengii]|uniref:isopeptide-forming domain-containing fimbrial protein n=1 Tax=Rhodococcus qingshengii TaxID=334542 RepID=UPI00287F48A6|nr:isopeptide-forming domain-containing fimbrial protein [Rhodococcus qingshengii]
MPNDIPPTRSAIFTAGLPPWVRAWTVVWTAIAMILGISGATAVVASAQPAATLGGPVQAQAPARAAVLPDEQPAKGCAFSAPGTGPFSQNICWIDMSTLDAATAASAAGQSMEIQLTDGYKINFKAFLTDSVAGKTHQGIETRELPTLHYAALGSSAYTGVPSTIKPAIYQKSADNGQSGGTVSLKNIVMTGPNGPIYNYGLVAADAESTDANTSTDKEFLTFNSDKPLRQIARTVGADAPGYPGIRACDGGLTAMPATTVRCDSWNLVNNKEYSPGTLVVASTAPTNFAATFGNTVLDTSRQGLAFGVLLSKVKIDKDLTRVTPGDDFTIGMSTGHHADAGAAAATEIKSTTTGATDTTASTGWRTLLADTTPTPVTFWEKPTTSATKTANYATSWDCQVNGVTQALRVGDVAQAALTPGDNVYCKVKNTPVLVKKSSSPPTGETVNIGQSITYTLNFENPGTAPATIDYTDYLADVIDDGTVAVGAATGGLTAALNGADKIKVGGTLPAGGKGTVTYTVTVKDGGNKVLNNYLVPGTTTPPTTCDPATNLCTTHPMPGFTLTKTADPVSGSTVQAGDTITYTVTGANTGKTALTPATIKDDLSAVLNNAAVVPGSLKATVDGAAVAAPTLSGSILSWSANLQAGKSVVLTYQVKVNAGVAAGTVLNNKVTGTAKPPTGPDITPPTVETNHSVPGFTLAKTADPISGSTVQAGESIKYTVTGTNTGKTKLDPVQINDDLGAVLNNAAVVPGSLKATIDGASVAVPTLSGTTLSWTGVLEAGKSVVLTYEVKVNDGVAAGTVLNNKVTGTAKPPTGPDITPPPVETNHSVPGFTVAKTADPASGTGVNAGQTIMYTVTGTNTGNTTLDPVVLTDDLSKVLDNATLVDGSLKATVDGAAATAPTLSGTTLSWTGGLEAGKSVVLTYQVKINDGVAGGVLINNKVTGTAKPPTGPEITPPPVTTEHPVLSPKIAVVKSSDPVSGSNVVAGQDIKYTLSFSNTGNGVGEVAYFDDLRQVVDKGALSGLTADAPLVATMVGSDGFSVTGTLAAGETKTVTYSVKVNADVVGGVFVNNFVVPGTTPPVDPPEVCDPATQLCTTHPVVSPKIAVVKSSDPVSGSNVVAGQDIKYTLTFSNTGNGAGEVAYFDDLRQVVDKGALSGLAADAPLVATMVGTDGFSVTGTLAAGESKSVTYSVKVNADVVGGVFVNNFVVPGTTPPVDPPEVCDPATQLCTTHPVKVPGFTVAKAADPASGTNVAAGQTITYTVTGTNTGNTTLDPVVLTDDLSKVLDNATLVDGSLKATVDGAAAAAPTLSGTTLSWTGVLEAGKSVVLTYQVKINDGVAGGTLINNKVTGTAKPPTGPEITPPPVTTEHPVVSPKIAVVKSSDPVSGSNVVAGQDIKYTLTFSNTGNGAGEVAHFDDLRGLLDDADLVAGSLSADAPLTAAMVGTDGFSVTGSLAAGESKTVTYTVTVKADADRVAANADNTVLNFVVPGTTPPVDPPEVCDPATQLCTTHPVKVPGFTVAKAADPVSGTNVAAGQTITYTVTGANTGNTTLDPVVLTDDLSKVLDNATLVDGSLKATVDGVDGAAPTLSGTTLTWTGALEAGKSVVLTYQVKINDGVAGGVLINNKVTGTAKPPTGPEITPPPVTTEHPVKVPGFTVAKAADPASGTNVAAGQTITYTVTGANTGNTTLDPVVLTDDLSKVLDNATLVDGSLKATVDGAAAAAPTLSGTTLSWTGVLEAGKSVVLTYQVKINDGVAGGTLINNKVTGTAKPPTGPEITPPPVTTEHPVDGTPAIEVLKSSVPSTTNRVVGGQEITYTLTFKNVGTADGEVSFYDDLTDVLDDAVMTKDPATTSTLVVSGVVDNVFTVTGKLAKGETATVTYTVKVNPEIGTLSGPGFTPGVLNNYLVVGGENPPVDCVPGDALCTEHPIDPPETTTTVPPTITTTPPVTTEPCVPPTTTTRMVPTTTAATTTASAITAGDADVTGTEESTTTEETTTAETTTEEVVAEEIVDPCGVTTTTPPTTTPPVTTVPPTTTVPNTTVPVTPTIIIPPIVVVPPIVVPPTVPGQPVPSTVPGQPKPPTANPGQPGQPKPSAPQGGTINSGGGAGESGVNTGLLAAGGLVLLLALGTGVVLLTRKRREDGDN